MPALPWGFLAELGMQLKTDLGTSCRAVADRVVSRRTVVQGLAAGAVVGCSDGPPMTADGALTPAQLSETVGGVLTTDDTDGHIQSVDEADLHLLRRISFGPTLDAVERLKAMGHTAYIEEQLAMRDDAIELDVLARYPLTANTPQAIYATTVIGGQPYWLHTRQYQNAMLYRAAHSRAQLYEVMVDVWNDHFNTYLYKNPVPLKLDFDRTVIRPHALGNFKALLRATVMHGEMLHYLDNHLNRSGAINENYARELLELHSLGREGGYGEADLKALARILSGWTYVRSPANAWRPTDALDYGQAVFDAAGHDTEPKTFLGEYFPAGGGAEELDRALSIILDHPGTARHVAHRLCCRLVADEPPPRLVAAVAQRYTATGGDIPSMLRTVLRSAEFRGSARQKLKRPIHALISAVRATGVDRLDQTLNYGLYGVAHNPGQLLQHLEQAGQAPFTWTPPDGFPDTAAYWSNTNTLLYQQKLIVRLAASRSYSHLLSDPLVAREQGLTVADDVAYATTAREAVSHAIANLLLGPMPAEAVARAIDYMADGGDPDAPRTRSEMNPRIQGLVLALLSSPWFLDK